MMMMSMMDPHPIHLHLVQIHIDGVPSGSLEDGWKDVVMIPAGGRQRSITAHFDGGPGIYMMHCHNLEHEDWDMMLQFEICDDNLEDHPCDPNLLVAFTADGGMGTGSGHNNGPGSSVNYDLPHSGSGSSVMDDNFSFLLVASVALLISL
jgi:hypothetical protein